MLRLVACATTSSSYYAENGTQGFGHARWVFYCLPGTCVVVAVVVFNSHLSYFLGKGILPSVDNHDFVICYWNFGCSTSSNCRLDPGWGLSYIPLIFLVFLFCLGLIGFLDLLPSRRDGGSSNGIRSCRMWKRLPHILNSDLEVVTA